MDKRRTPNTGYRLLLLGRLGAQVFLHNFTFHLDQQFESMGTSQSKTYVGDKQFMPDWGDQLNVDAH